MGRLLQPKQIESGSDGYVLTTSGSSVVWSEIPSGSFTGNTSGDCIGDIYVSNIHSCSPLLINPNDEGNVYMGSNSGFTYDSVNDRVGVGLGITATASRFHVKGVGSTNATSTFLVENSSGNDLLNMLDDGSVFFNANAIPTANFSIYGDTDTSLFKTNAATDSIGIGIAGQSTSKLYVDATNETRNYIAVFGSNTAQNGVLINTSATNTDVFGVQATIATNNATGTARAVYANSIGANGRDNYAVYARTGNGSRDNIAINGQQVFAGGTGTNAGVFGADSSPNTVVKHGVFGTVNTGTDGVTTTGYAVRGVAGMNANDATNYALHGRISLNGSVTGATGYGLFIEDGSAVGAGSTVYGLVVEGVNENSGFGTATPNTTVDINGSFATRGSSPAQLTGNTNDWVIPEADFIRMDTNGNYNLTGIAGGVDGRRITIVNIAAANAIVLQNEDANSTAANRIILIGQPITIVPKGSVTLIYDATSARWRVIGSLQA